MDQQQMLGQAEDIADKVGFAGKTLWKKSAFK